MELNHSVADQLASGQLARLIPVVADSKKEERATSILLSAFMVVKDLAHSIFAEAGISIPKTAQITCLTEVTFKSKDLSKIRPDGLIIASRGKKAWAALVESKVGTAELKTEQVEAYLDLAKELGLDAVITFSNQFATLPTHHPVAVQKSKKKSVGLFHFSWLSVLSKAVLLAGSKSIEDPEQAYLLSEVIRYFEHEASGVTAMTKMSSSWKDVCSEVQRGGVLRKNAEEVVSAVSSWQQLLRFLGIQLSTKTGVVASIKLPKKRADDPEVNLSDNIDALLKNSALDAEISVPNAASEILFTADLLRRTISFSMKLDAPNDRSRATAAINWVTKQLSDAVGLGLVVKAHYPRRIPMMTAMLDDVLSEPERLIPEGVKDLPTSIEIVRITDLAGRFGGSRTFVEDCDRELPKFYAEVGQKLTKWTPPAPKVKEPKQDITEIQPVSMDVPVLVPEFVYVNFES